jgi:hypothetical protein
VFIIVLVETLFHMSSQDSGRKAKLPWKPKVSNGVGFRVFHMSSQDSGQKAKLPWKPKVSNGVGFRVLFFDVNVFLISFFSLVVF